LHRLDLVPVYRYIRWLIIGLAILIPDKWEPFF
jgi:hypothetical protein